MHKCCKCKRTDNQSSFLGFHAFEYTEICDDCAHIYGCGCCQDISDYAWERFWVSLGFNFDESHDYAYADHEREIEHRGEWY